MSTSCMPRMRSSSGDPSMAHLATTPPHCCSAMEPCRLNCCSAARSWVSSARRFPSAKTLESAEGNLRALETQERAAEQQLSLQGSMAEQQWGGVVAKWAMDGSPELDRILGMHEVLIQVTLPFGQSYTAPKTILVEVPGRTRAEATLISAFPRVDPRIQGRSFLYSAAAQPDFTPGVNLVSHFAVGNSTHGVVVPASAVVWSEGKAWAYLQTGARQFSRRELATDSPVDGGYFVTAGFSTANKVVTKGAQSLLSEEAVLEGY